MIAMTEGRAKFEPVSSNFALLLFMKLPVYPGLLRAASFGKDS